jgi:hypothetical protein
MLQSEYPTNADWFVRFISAGIQIQQQQQQQRQKNKHRGKTKKQIGKREPNNLNLCKFKHSFKMSFG